MTTVLLALAALLPLDEVADLIKKIRTTTDYSQRYQAENELGRALKANQLPLVMKELDAGPADLRPCFVRVLRTFGGKEGIAALKGILSKYEMKTRVEAAYALKILNDLDGMKMLVGEIQKPGLSKEDKLAILQYLYSFYYDGKEVPPALRKVIETDKDKDVRSRALQSLASHKDPESASFLRKLAENEADELRCDALAALIKLGESEAIEQGLQALEKGKVPLQQLYNILFALRTAGGRDVAERLRALLDRTDDVNVRTQIIYTLSQLKDTKSVPMLIKLAEDKNASIAEAAVNALVELAGRSQIATLQKLLKHETLERRLKAAEALIALDDRSGIPVLREALNEKTPYQRQRAVTALAACRCAEVVEPLLFAMSDEDENVRQQAANGVISVLSALFPYRKFELAKVGYEAKGADVQARKDAIGRIREWWEKNR